VDASGFQGPFEHWQQREDKVQLREPLFRDLMGILHSHAYRRFGCIVINQAFDTLSEELRKGFRLCAYSLAGLNCEKQVRQHLLKEWKSSDPQMPVRIVFEHGDEGFGSLCDWLRSAQGTIPPSRAYKKDTVQEDGLIAYGFVPLQAADWLAYELGLAVRQMENGRVKRESDLRWPMKQFMRVLGDANTYYAEDIAEAERKLNILKNIPNWDKETDFAKLSELLKPVHDDRKK
jgi:hypothetical protein